MNLSITLRHGPLDIEIEGEDRKEIQEGILGLADFIEQHGDSIARFEAPKSEPENAGNGSAQTNMNSFTDSESPERNAKSQESFDSRYGQIAQETDVDEERLSKLIDLPDDEEGVPSINTYHFDAGTEVFGKARNQRQSQASALLLYIWDVCLDEKRIKFDRLDRALVSSDIETERRKDMYSAFSGNAGDWFESGDGNIWIVGRGKKHIRDLIVEKAEQI